MTRRSMTLTFAIVVATIVVSTIPTRAASTPIALRSQAQPATTRGAVTPAEAPNELVTGSVGSFVLESGMLFWSRYQGCSADDFPPVCELRSIPTNGSRQRMMHRQVSPFIESALVADATYVYWITSNDRLVRLPHGATTATSPSLVVTKENAAASGQIAIDNEYVYWTENYDPAGTSSDSFKLFRAPKAGGSRQMMQMSTTPIRQLQAGEAGDVFYISSPLFADTLFHIHDTGGGTFSNEPISSGVQSYTLDMATIYWTEKLGSSPARIKRAPRGDLGASTILHTLGSSGSPNVAEMAVDTGALYWHEYRFPGGPIYRLPLAGGTPEPISAELTSVTDLASSGRFLFWTDSDTIYRLPVNAGATALDLVGNDVSLEVVQTIQSPANDVPLIADKDTFVRAYGRIGSSSTGVSSLTLWPAIELTGTRDGVPLPGSPLSPVINRAGILQNAPIDRTSLDQGFLFHLPPGWTDGAVTLRAELNPRRVRTETDYANNSSTVTVTFNRKATLCLDMIPVQTVAGTISGWSPELESHFARAASMWPVTHFRSVWRGGPPHRSPRQPLGIFGSDPYGLMTDEDQWFLMLNLTVAYLLSEAPRECDGLQTIRTAMVPIASKFGLSHPAAPIIFFLRGDGGRPENAPNGGTRGLAHELGHQLFRWHVQCPTSGPGSPPLPWAFYPYPVCQLDDVGPNSHIGFDPITRQLLLPATTADFMSYSPGLQWASDITYNSIFALLGNRAGVATLVAATREAEVGDSKLLVSGLITGTAQPTGGSAMINYGYQLSGSALADVSSKVKPSANPGQDFRLRTYGEDGTLLTDSPLDVANIAVEGGPPALMFFMLVDTTPARIEVARAGGAVIGSRAAGSGRPTIVLTKPAAGDSIDDVLRLRWNASDPDGDALMYTARYSHDGGATWVALGNSTTSTMLDVDLSDGLPGGDAALVQVIASDGLNSAEVTVGPLAVRKHAPRATMMNEQYEELTPTRTAAAAHNQTVVLRGRGYDAEDGNLEGPGLQWEVTGPVTRSGQGMTLSLAGLPPGMYDVRLTATDGDGKSSGATTKLTISPRRVFDGKEPMVDGSCDDAAYDMDHQPIPLLTVDGEVSTSTAALRLIHVSGRVYACFSGLLAGKHGSDLVELRLDLDNSGGSALQADDRLFIVGRDGVVRTGRGDSKGGEVLDALPQKLRAVVSETDGQWSAELAVDADTIGAWHKLTRLYTREVDEASTNARSVWPAEASAASPGTWASTAFGQLSQAISFAPLPDRFLSSPPFALRATTSSSLPISFVSDTPAICTVERALVTLRSTGTCAIRAVQPGDASYAAAQPVAQSFTVEPTAAQPAQIFLPLVRSS